MVLKEVENQIYYQSCLIKSLEAKLERVEPASDEFEEVMHHLFQAREELNKLNFDKIKSHYFKSVADIERGKDYE